MQSILINDLSVDYSLTNPTSLAKSDNQAKQLFGEFGCFLAKELLTDEELNSVRCDIRQLIELKMQQLGLQKESTANALTGFDEGFQQLSQLEYMHGQVIKHAARLLISIHQINVNPKLVRLSKKLMSTNTLMANMLFDIRVDRPYEDEHLFPWHQDYPVIQDSEDAVVYWIPLRNVEEQDGCLQIAPGSHKLGVLPRRARSKNEPPSVDIVDWSILRQFPHLHVPMQIGDVLVFNTLMLHASGVNRSDRIRWTLQIRHGNFEHSKAIARGWPASMALKMPFERSHPEYIIGSPLIEDTNSREQEFNPYFQLPDELKRNARLSTFYGG
ncbi:phytanoyl-CoA dioxygenase family protein [Nostoc sp. MG11]|uniref:phytanoyl-CoA dioxygenase family protein n=1 Tax=Nostoc sp. MG11 TaxID=2721166 RepID=UPI001866FB24|nr:phytanoyl-CoA dioxygenase family protein [Nostoc sp. MG11]